MIKHSLMHSIQYSAFNLRKYNLRYIKEEFCTSEKQNHNLFSTLPFWVVMDFRQTIFLINITFQSYLKS